MRVLLYTPAVPMEAGGVQAVFNRLAVGLDARGHTVKRVWSVPHYHSERPSMDAYFPHLDGPPGWGTRRDARETLRMHHYVWRELYRLRPDVVNIHFVRPDCRYLLRLRRVFGYKVVLSFHGSDVLRTRPEDAPYLPRMVRSADAVTAVSRPVAEGVARLPGFDADRVQIIPNGIDFDYWSEGYEPRRAAASSMVLAVGRLTAVKGHDVLIDAFAHVVKAVPGARLTILGGGEDEAALTERIERLKLTDAVTLGGQATPEVVREHLARAAVFALPSRSEGMPLSLLEAMAAGVPCVASAVGGVPDVLSEATGLTVPPEDPAALAEALIRLLRHPETRTRLAEAGHECSTGYTADRCTVAHESLFKKLNGSEVADKSAFLCTEVLC